MAKGVSIKFKSYEETIPKLLALIKFDQEIKKHNSIVLKPSLKNSDSRITSADFLGAVLQFCVAHKNSSAKIYIAEGSDGEDTRDNFESAHYKPLAEKYGVSLIDLNTSETEEVNDMHFTSFDTINYPKILRESYVISMPVLADDLETEIQGSLSTMLGAFPAAHYKGFLSSKKTKIKKSPMKYAVHDILRCKMPDLAIIDASEQGVILTGNPLEMDKQASKLVGRDWRTIQHIRFVDDSFSNIEREKAEREAAKAKKTAEKI